MTSYLRKYPPVFQIVVFLGLYIGFTAIYYFFIMSWAMPRLTGVTLMDLHSGYVSDPYILEVLKWMQLLYSVVSFLLPALLFFYLSDPDPLGYGDLRKDFRLQPALLGVIILLASLPFVGVLSDWNQMIHFGSLDQAFRQANQQAEDITRAMLKMPHWRTLLYNLILIAAIPAIAEELFFRGVIQRLLVQISRRAWIGVLLASLFFSLLHGEMLGFFPRVALGMVLGLIYYISGNLWYSILAHFINNGAQVLLLFLFQKHLITFDLTASTSTPLVAGIISLAIVFGLFLIFWKFMAEKGVPGIFVRQNRLIEPE